MMALAGPAAWHNYSSDLFCDLDDGERIRIARQGEVNQPGSTMAAWTLERGRPVDVGYEDVLDSIGVVFMRKCH